MSNDDIRVIVAGCRNFYDYDLLKAKLNLLIAPMVFKRSVEIVSGGAEGADKLGERFAAEYNITVKIFAAEWDKYGKSAGPIRNKQMAEYATHCVCFWDGVSRGTKNMIDVATAKGLIVKIVRI